MRMSTSMIFDRTVSAMQSQTTSLLHTQQQISTGRRLVAASDDPTAASNILQMTQAKEVNNQYTSAQGGAKTALSMLDSQLQSVGDLIQYVQQRTVLASNGTLNAKDLSAIAKDIQGQFEQLTGLANSTDGMGQYMFAGNMGDTKPFTGDLSTGMTYQGDQGVRSVQVSSSRQMPVSVPGDAIFVGHAGEPGLFDTLSSLVTTLENPTGATFRADINSALSNLSKSLDTVLTERAYAGSRLNELESLSTATESMGLQYSQILSGLQDTDYTKAIADLSKQQMALQASQKSFLQVSSLSLFNYMQ